MLLPCAVRLIEGGCLFRLGSSQRSLRRFNLIRKKQTALRLIEKVRSKPFIGSAQKTLGSLKKLHSDIAFLLHFISGCVIESVGRHAPRCRCIAEFPRDSPQRLYSSGRGNRCVGWFIPSSGIKRPAMIQSLFD